MRVQPTDVVTNALKLFFDTNKKNLTECEEAFGATIKIMTLTGATRSR